MNVPTLYDPNQKVYFLLARESNTNILLFYGEVAGIKIEISDYHIKKIYSIRSYIDGPNFEYLDINEKNLFDSEEEVIKFFRENIRKSLTHYQKKETDDLPF